MKKTTTTSIPIFQIKNIHKLIVNRVLVLNKGEELYLELKGSGDVVLTMPLIYKEKKNSQKYFVFLICADTLRADHLGIYGYPKNISKNITDFSHDSVIFDNCFSQSSWTLPAHMSLFTGQDVFNHGVYNKNQKVSQKVNILTEILYNKYFNVSYNGNVFVSYKYGFHRGFDFYTSHISNRKKNLIGSQSPETAREIFVRMVGLLKKVRSPRIFSFLHTYQVHSPYRLHPGLPFSDTLSKKKKAPFFIMPHGLVPRELIPANAHRFIFRELRPQRRERIINLYDAEIEFFDHWFGFFLNTLKEMGLYEQSMIILLSDHGEEFFDHKSWGHGHSLYNELIRVPLIIKFPEQEFKGKRVISNVSLIDVFPTIFDYFDIKYQIKIDGESFLPIIRSGEWKQRGDRKILSILKYVGDEENNNRFPQKVAVIHRNFKLIFNFKYTSELIKFYTRFPPPTYQEFELYDLDKDSGEKFNLVSAPEYKAVLEKLKIEIRKIKKAIIRSQKKGIPIQLTEDDFERLKSLGYI